MKFTFGIVTKSENNFGENDPSSADKTNITKLIESINNLEIPEYEIIVVGGKNIYNQKKNIYNQKKNILFLRIYIIIYSIQKENK